MDKRTGIALVLLAVFVVGASMFVFYGRPSKGVGRPLECEAYATDYFDFNDVDLSLVATDLQSTLPMYFDTVQSKTCYEGFATLVLGSGECGRAFALCNLQVDIDTNSAFIRCAVTAPAGENTLRSADVQCKKMREDIEATLSGGVP